MIAVAGCGPVAEPEISINDWTEQTKSTAHHIARDTYTVVISYLDKRVNDTINTVYSHYPNTEQDVVPEPTTHVSSFFAPDNEHRKGYGNVKDIKVITATISSNNIEYIQAMMRRQDSTKELKRKVK